jgi:hypothetical protein
MKKLETLLPPSRGSMSKLVGLVAVDWLYRCNYIESLERSGRKSLRDWELELKNWDPEVERTTPSRYTLANLRYNSSDLRHTTSRQPQSPFGISLVSRLQTFFLKMRLAVSGVTGLSKRRTSCM